MGRLLGQGRSERPLPKVQTSAIAPIFLSATGTFKAIDHLSEIRQKRTWLVGNKPTLPWCPSAEVLNEIFH